jgi:hypothetical protein
LSPPRPQALRLRTAMATTATTAFVYLFTAGFLLRLTRHDRLSAVTVFHPPFVI